MTWTNLGSTVQSELEGFRQNCDPVVVILRRRLPLDLRLDVEAGHQPGEEQEQLGFCQGLAKALTFAYGEWDEVIVLLARARRWIEEPLRPENLPVTPVGALEQLHHEWPWSPPSWFCEIVQIKYVDILTGRQHRHNCMEGLCKHLSCNAVVQLQSGGSNTQTSSRTCSLIANHTHCIMHIWEQRHLNLASDPRTACSHL